MFLFDFWPLLNYVPPEDRSRFLQRFSQFQVGGEIQAITTLGSWPGTGFKYPRDVKGFGDAALRQGPQEQTQWKDFKK